MGYIAPVQSLQSVYYRERLMAGPSTELRVPRIEKKQRIKHDRSRSLYRPLSKLTRNNESSCHFGKMIDQKM